MAQSRASRRRTAITEDRKTRTAELFHEALAREPDQQASFLKEACAGDADLFRKLKELLDSYAEVRTIGPVSGKPATQLLDSDTLVALGERYEDIKPIGHGGMGFVLRAHDRELDKVVALKMLHPSLADDERAIQRFRKEIRLALDITHKNVCRTYGLERVDGKILISMEYVEGETLRSILDCIRGVSVPQALSWAAEICEGLTAAHDKGIVHCDLKPGNIMIDRDGQAKVMDFGIAGPIEAGERTAGTVVGTPQYMSPEQARGRTVGPASDIYSLGLLLYELFTGDRRDPEHPARPSEVNPYLPARIDRAIQRCLEENPRDRFQTAHELKTALIKEQQFPGGEVALLSFARKRRSMVTIVLMLCALLAGLVIGGIYVFQRNRPPTAGMHQDDEITDLAFSPNGHLLASASEDRTVVLWNVANQRKKRTLAGHIGAVTSVAFSSNGRWLASGSADKTIKVWDVETGDPKSTLKDSKTIATVALSPDGRWLASTSDESVRLWDVPASRLAHVVRHNDAVGPLAFSPDGHLLASGGADKTVRVWEVETGHIAGGPLHHDDEVTALAFSPDGRLLASGSLDKTIKLWQLGTWMPENTLFHQARLSNVAFNVYGNLASISDDGKVKHWEAPTWRELGSQMVTDRNTARTWAFSPDGLSVAVGTSDGKIEIHALKMNLQK